MYLHSKFIKVVMCMIIMAHIMCHSNVLAQDGIINPPFGLEWRDHASELPKKANVILRNATQEENYYIASRISNAYREVVTYVVDRYIEYNVTFKGYILTTDRSKMLTIVALVREDGSLVEFNNICEKIAEAYGKPKTDSFSELYIGGIRSHEKRSWKNNRTGLSVYYTKKLFGGDEIMILFFTL